MQIQAKQMELFQFDKILKRDSIKQDPQHYFNKHWQVIYTSIKLFILQKASVNIAAFQKSLQLLVLHRHSQRIKGNLQVLWTQIFKQILLTVESTQVKSNPLISFIELYKTTEDRFKVVFTLLKSYLQKPEKHIKNDQIDEFGNFISYSKQTVENVAFRILCNLILSSKLSSSYFQQMILLINAFRNSNYFDQTEISQQSCKDEVRLDLLIIKKIGLFNYLQKQFLQSSKDFYLELSKIIPKDNNFLEIVNGYLQRQIQLNLIFEPTQNTVHYLQKQLIRQSYEFILDQLFEDVILKTQQKSLRIFWSFTLRLGDQAMTKLFERLKKIIEQTKKYFTNRNKPIQQIFTLVSLRQNLFGLIDVCFNKNRKISNLIYNTFQQMIYAHQKDYLSVALQNILQEKETQNKIYCQEKQNRIMFKKQQSSFDQNKYFKLFRIAPSKQNFIRQFEIRFTRWILTDGFNIKTLKMQQSIITQMRKQVGNNLTKKLDRMINDVWRQNSMHFLNQTTKSGMKLKCIFLSSDWPVHLQIVFNIPDDMYKVLSDFQDEYKISIENKGKQIKWIHQMGTVIMTINGIQSTFSQIQASIIMILDKSIRPLRKEQIQASLNVCNMNQTVKNFSPDQFIADILEKLVKNNILDLNPSTQTYDINDDNLIGYRHIKVKQQKQVNSIKQNQHQRDNVVLIEAAIVRILKRRRTMQRNDISKFIIQNVKNFRPTFEQITKVFQSLENRQFLSINRNKGIITYIQ